MRPHDRASRRSARAVLLLLAAGWLCLPGALLAAEEPPANYSRAALIHFDGPIGAMLEYYVSCKLNAARRQGAELVIIQIDSPGGYVEQSLNVAHQLRDLDWADTVAYVPEQALSGAAFVALGCGQIIMGPNAKLGDAGPIYLAEGWAFREVPAKFRTHLVAEVRDLAQSKGRPPALAEAMVDKDLEVFRVRDRDSGKEAFLSDKDIQADEKPDRWEKLNPVQESLGGNFLEVTGARAVELGLAEGNAAGLEELLGRYGLRERQLVVFEYRGMDTVVYVLNRSWVTALLLVVGLVALYVELSVPGIGVGGLTAGLCFAIFFWSRFLGGTADVLDVILFVSGVAFLLVELFVLPGFGVAGVSGIILILASLILASQTFIIPRDQQQWTQLLGTLVVLLGSGLAFAFAAYLLSRHFGSLPVLGQMVLAPPEPDGGAGGGSSGGEKSPVAIGSRGLAVSALRPAGKARFGHEYLDVVTDGEFITKGSPVEIVDIRGNRVVVVPVGGN